MSNVYLMSLADGGWHKSGDSETTDYDGWHNSQELIVTCGR